MGSGCCGQPAARRRRVSPGAPPPPANPKVLGGVRLLYLGSGRQTLEGQATGLAYHVAEGRRWFKVHPDDAAAMLRRPYVILAL